METGKLKKFAAEARTNLMDGVRMKLRSLGFDENGNLIAREPELIQGATLWKGEEYPEAFYHQWKALQDKLQHHGVREVVEEAAYTWFNRMMAIRILTKNNLCEPILMTEGSASGYPLLLEAARMGRVPSMDAQERRRFDQLMDDDTRTYDQFALLLSVWCHDNPIIHTCFGSLHDFVELLLPENIIKPNGFIAQLNTTDFITEEDFKSAELIGWLYQFYISDRKDEVMKKQKYASDEIPAATQIFTPNWIVKYMVENTILPQVDAPDDILEKAKYLVMNPDAAPSEKIELEDLKVADFACGSGHILNECFDLLFDLYREEAYSRKEAVEAIFTKNLLGIDIDLRAKQLATFALLLKACQQDKSFADAHCLPRVLTVPDMPKIVEDPEGYLPHFFLGSATADATKELCAAWEDIKHADVLGSIIKFNLSDSTRRQVKEAVAHWREQDFIFPGIQAGLPIMDFILALTDSYNAFVSNPPYMSTSKESVLKRYAQDNYPISKTDMYTIFIERMLELTKDNGRVASITLESWMFLSSFESFRKNLIDKYYISSMGHFDWYIIGIAFGTVMTIVEKSKPNGRLGEYSYLTIEDIDKTFNIPFTFPKKNNGRYVKMDQSQFNKIPGSPLAYWISDILRDSFNESNLIGSKATVRSGFSTGDNDRFIRGWQEVSSDKIAFGIDSFIKYSDKDYKFIPFVAGGKFRRWYGNQTDIVDWSCHSEMHRPRTTYMKLYLQPGITWNAITSSKISCRYYPQGFLFEHAAASLFVNKGQNRLHHVSFINSKVFQYVMEALNPTFNNGGDTVSSMPLIGDNENYQIAEENICISKEDWDAHETSWDFKENELVNISKQGLGIHTSWIGNPNNVVARGGHLELLINEYEVKWEELFMKLHANEEELNRKFIEIYGLQDELTPEVPLDEITILQQGEISIEKEAILTDEGSHILTIDGIHPIVVNLAEEKIVWHRDVIIKQLISYIVGCYMGRYRLDKPGLAIAHPNPKAEELADYQFNISGEETFKIDPDAIIPVLPTDAPFYDNLYNYVSEFIRKVWGAETHTENMNFIDRCLGKPLNDYLMRDFWKDHKKMYQHRPIYWEFASPKGSFRAIVYAHRMDRFTVEVLRSKYLLPYRNFIEQKIANMEARTNELSTAEKRELDNLRKKTLPELIEYHDRVEQVAAESAARETVFDLDDGIPHNHALFGSIVTKLK